MRAASGDIRGHVPSTPRPLALRGSLFGGVTCGYAIPPAPLVASDRGHVPECPRFRIIAQPPVMIPRKATERAAVELRRARLGAVTIP